MERCHEHSLLRSFASCGERRRVAGRKRNGSMAWGQTMRTIAALLILALAAMTVQQAIGQQACPSLVITNNNDVVNGDTSSPCALIANNGGDGISLREALLAANNAT